MTFFAYYLIYSKLPFYFLLINPADREYYIFTWEWTPTAGEFMMR